MNAIVKSKAGPGLELQQVAKPKIGTNDVLIKIQKTSICGTDLHIYAWDEWAQKTIKPPVTIGHEYVGEIVEVGSNVEHFKVGERVSGEGHIVCGQCRNCLAGNRHLCPHTKGVGVERNGAFAEYLAIPASNAWRADPSISDAVMSCFDPLGNAVHTALTFPLIGEDILITGAGPIGCMAAAIAKHAGARNIVVTDINDYRLDLARKMGATLAVNDNDVDLKDVRKELGITEGFNVGLEMSGSIKAFSGMIDNMLNGGKIALLGILPAGGGIDWTKVIFKSLTLQGIYGRKMFDTWYQASALIKGGLDITPIITHNFHYKEFEKGFQLMKSGQAGKITLDWS